VEIRPGGDSHFPGSTEPAPIPIATRHEFANVPVENSEGARIRDGLERKRAQAPRSAQSARERMARAWQRSQGRQTNKRQLDSFWHHSRKGQTSPSWTRSLHGNRWPKPPCSNLSNAKNAPPSRLASVPMTNGVVSYEREKDTSRRTVECTNGTMPKTRPCSSLPSPIWCCDA
jgi:ribosomal protein L32E